MLYAEKENLKTSLALETLQIRDKEIIHYVNTISAVSTQATLLAGFAFAQLTGYQYIHPADGYFTKSQMDKLGIGHVVEDPDDRGIAGWTWYTWLTQLSQLLFVICTATALFLQLWTVQSCTITGVQGQGLALRGPPGSVSRALRHMARQSTATYKMFSLGIGLIKVSTLLYVFNAFSIFVSIPCIWTCTVISWRSYNSEQVLSTIFEIPDDEAVSSALVEHKAHLDIRRSSRKKWLQSRIERVPCIGGLFRQVVEAMQAGADMGAAGDASDIEDAVETSETLAASTVANELIARTQGPITSTEEKAATRARAVATGRAPEPPRSPRACAGRPFGRMPSPQGARASSAAAARQPRTIRASAVASRPSLPCGPGGRRRRAGVWARRKIQARFRGTLARVREDGRLRAVLEEARAEQQLEAALTIQKARRGRTARRKSAIPHTPPWSRKTSDRSRTKSHGSGSADPLSPSADVLAAAAHRAAAKAKLEAAEQARASRWDARWDAATAGANQGAEDPLGQADPLVRATRKCFGDCLLLDELAADQRAVEEQVRRRSLEEGVAGTSASSIAIIPESLKQAFRESLEGKKDE